MEKRLCTLFALLLLCFTSLPAHTNSSEFDVTGCDEQLVYWDLDACVSFASDGSNLDYSEFTPNISTPSGFTSINASIVSSEGSHSCVSGQSGAALCHGIKNGCSWSDNNSNAIRFSITINPTNGNTVNLSKLQFYESAPLHFVHLSGNSGDNDPPSKYGVRILKNGQEVYQQTGMNTSEAWSLEQFDLSNDPDFEITTTTTFDFELLGYCRSNGTSGLAAWDVDEIKVFGCSEAPDPCASQGGDSDGDGVCDNQDCQPNNPNFPATVGTACNDNNPNTENDVVQSDGCSCAGTPIDPCANNGGDSDGDGTCDNQDCQPNNPNFPATPGSSCDDGNPNTTNDVVQADGCSCAGTPTANCDVTVSVSSDGCEILLNGFSDPDAKVQIFTADYSNVVYACNPWSGNSCGTNQAIDGLPNGTYHVFVNSANCDFIESVTIDCGTSNPCANQGGDSDGDGVCDNQDCQPNNPNFPATPGTTCDDGNPNTTNDMVTSDGCGCEGTPAGGGTCTNPTNVALNKTATQSSTITANGITGSAFKAVDGNTNGVFFTGDNATSSVSATNNEFQAYWQVDLGAEYNIEQVKLYNRTDGTDKTDDCYLIISSTPFGNADLNTALNQANYSHYEQGAVGNPSIETPPAGTTGRYVRIQLNGTGYLVLAEVEVIGCIAGGGDPCANGDGDSDGDGVCDNQDCQPNNPNFPATPGTSCDDGNPNTTNDMVTADGCGCAGTPTGGCAVTVSVSADGCEILINGISDSQAKIQIFDASYSNAVYACNPWSGNSCGTNQAIDGLPNGTYHVFVNTANCDFIEHVTIDCGTSDPCANQGGDSDGDGTCDNQDCQPNNPSFPATPGSSCDDGNPNTTNDIVTSDGCGCQGTPTSTCNVVVSVSADDCDILINGISDSQAKIQIFDASYANVVYACNPWSGNSCGTSQVVDGLANGTYHVFVNTANCDFIEHVTIDCGISNPCANQGGDSDGDGTCDNQDCQPNNPNLPAPVGSSCNDGNSNTSNDVIQGDGCTCAGTPITPDCNSVTLVRYKMDNCESFFSNGSNLDFSEFTPDYPNASGCLNVNASNLSNNEGGHSCVDGANGSYAGICILGEPGTSFKNDDDDALRFSITVNPGTIGKLTQLSFYEQSPAHYQHISGNSGSNHYLQRFGVRVLKNGVEVFKQTGLDVSQSGWDFESFSFDGIAAFEINSTATFDFEILGYKPYGGSSSQMYFDVDDIKVKGCCNASNQQFAVPNMMNFGAKKDGRHSAISWLMAKDTDVDYYEVEVSTDETIFRTIGDVAADQVNSPRSYDLMDYDPTYGDNYYRLKVFNMDGTTYYSSVRRLNYDIDFGEIAVYPNPTNDQINITLKDFAGTQGVIEIYNQLGQRQLFREYNSLPTVPVNMNVSNFVPGIYTISVKVDNQRRFAKQFVVVDK